ncbi:MAG: N-acetylmuramoyl-L-alanine amidase [Paracoccaceae bacterium]|nr:N-acetylmuramoyl-L-alanine amidase [Paracoccaceae bacterium]MDE3240612.1 N-acetylmuramoyl-L-alanine amidase [Paracoccaceae bacterium]
MSSILRTIARGLAVLAACLCLSAPAGAQSLSALAQFDPAASTVADAGAGIAIDLTISQPVPYRISTLPDPDRLILDFHEVDWSALDPAAFAHGSHVTALRAGLLVPGWSRLVLQLDGPYRVTQAEMATRDLNGRARVQISLAPTTREAFDKGAGAPPPVPGAWDMPKPAVLGPPKRRQTGEGPIVVVLDPGHGGIDPGSVQGKVDEKTITLAFARQLRELLVRNGIKVVMTRSGDYFVPLETRLSIARAAQADLFLSIHADAEWSGQARGATVYTLANKATDQASAELAARHDRNDIMAGVDLRNTTDRIATVLMDMARTETQPRSQAFAAALVAHIKGAQLEMHSRPEEGAAFSVLKSPDIPSALLELGYLSSKSDRQHLRDPAWRKRMAEAILAAIEAWAKADAAQAALVRH